MNSKKYFHERLGIHSDTESADTVRKELQKYIDLKLAFLGLTDGSGEHAELVDLAQDLIQNYRERSRLLEGHICPADRRIQDFLNAMFSDVSEDTPQLPNQTFTLDRHGLARELSLPRDGDSFSSDIINSYRIDQGILNNPRNDRRTTKGVFHVAEGGLPIPFDKKAVPKDVCARIFCKALHPPDSLLELPYCSGSSGGAKSSTSYVSLLLRPITRPEVPGRLARLSMEVRFFAPGNLVSNLDFVESIFGNGGDPELPENDAALDTEHWSGTTGCVILAPHLSRLTKKELGLPQRSKASQRQIRDGMCWEKEDELYNDGDAFKLTCRDERGVIVTVIADNYYGYCKKEVKTQISYTTNLLGMSEEEHAGGALVFPSYHLGYSYKHHPSREEASHTFANICKHYADMIDIKPEGYGVDRKFPKKLFYVPEGSSFDVEKQQVEWQNESGQGSLKLLPGRIYMLPTGYKVRFEKHPWAPSWRFVGTEPEGTYCHKPSTVSGGGKSEISKSFSDAFIHGPFFVNDIEKDFSAADAILKRPYGDQYIKSTLPERASRPILNPLRSLGSTIRLLMPSSEYTETYNTWLRSIPPQILSLVFIIKRFYHISWEEDWRSHFSVDIVNGSNGHELKFEGRKLTADYVRIGYERDEIWRTFKLRQDFIAADKLQLEDDISASTVVPRSWLTSSNAKFPHPCLKIVENCEWRFFQRPDEARHRGFDRQAESDLAAGHTFVSNFEPLTPADAREMLEDVIEFDKFTPSMRRFIRRVAQKSDGFFISSDRPRIVDGSASKNPRYLQTRQDVSDPFPFHLAETGIRLHRQLPVQEKILHPVNAMLPGHRNNPPEKGILPLSVYNPIHYLDLPELFMDFVCSLTGKSPSTTGAGSEGALTKGPFNALLTTADLNTAIVCHILTGYHGFFTAAGHIGPKFRVDHDISLLMPEIWGRIPYEERSPDVLLRQDYLERLVDFEHEGKKVLASRLGSRITINFVHAFLGKIFDNPATVFSPDILQPEKQDMAAFVSGIHNIVDAQRRVALQYFEDNSIEQACPPLKAVLHIMAHGHYEGLGSRAEAVRKLFDRDHLLKSDWYQLRLKTQRDRELNLCRRHLEYLEAYRLKNSQAMQNPALRLRDKMSLLREQIKSLESPESLTRLVGTLGADPLGLKPAN